MGDSPDPEPAVIRVLRRMSGAMGKDALRTDVCTLFPRVEGEIVRDLESALRAKDYDSVNRLGNELSEYSRIKGEMCPARM